MFSVTLMMMKQFLYFLSSAVVLSSSKEARCVFRGEGTMDMEGEIRLLDPEGGANIT